MKAVGGTAPLPATLRYTSRASCPHRRVRLPEEKSGGLHACSQSSLLRNRACRNHIGAGGRCLRRHTGGALNRLSYTYVGAATAQIPVHAGVNFLICRLRMLSEERGGGHN